MKYNTVKEISQKWTISERRITKLCEESRIDGAIKFGWSWAIPENASKPLDERTTKNKDLIINDKHLINALEILPDDYWDFKTADTRKYIHGLHSYPATMIYPISRNIIKIVSQFQTIDTIFDPYCGSGTVLVEGMINKISNLYGNDMNPLAQLLSRVKTRPLDSDFLDKNIYELQCDIESTYKQYEYLLSSIEDFTNENDIDYTINCNWSKNANNIISKFLKNNNVYLRIPEFKNLGYWFNPKVLIELGLIYKSFEMLKNEEFKEFIKVAYSETIRIVSNRRNGEFKMFRMPIEKVSNYRPNVKLEFFNILLKNKSKMNDFYEVLDEKSANVYINNEDAKDLINIPDNSMDIVITSPPYGDSKTTVAYGEFSKLTLQWLNLNNFNETQISRLDKSLMGGIRQKYDDVTSLESNTLTEAIKYISNEDAIRAEEVYSFYSDLDKCLSAISKKSKQNTYQFWVVGNRTVKSKLLRTDKILIELAEKYNLKWIYTIDRNISNKVMPAINSPTNKKGVTNTTMTQENIVVLRKI